MRGPGSYTYEPDNDGCVLLLEFIGRDPPVLRLTLRMPMREAMMPTIDAMVWNETGNCSFSPEEYLQWLSAGS